MKSLEYIAPEMVLVSANVNADPVSNSGSDKPIELPLVPAGRSGNGIYPYVP